MVDFSNAKVECLNSNGFANIGGSGGLNSAYLWKDNGSGSFIRANGNGCTILQHYTNTYL